MAITIVRRANVSLYSAAAQFNGRSGTAGRDGAKFKEIGAERIRHQSFMSKMASTARLSQDEEAAAIAAFKRTKGITKYPTAFVAPSQAATK